MEIYDSMIAHLLKQQYPKHFVERGKEERTITSIRMFDKEADREDVLYIVMGETIPEQLLHRACLVVTPTENAVEDIFCTGVYVCREPLNADTLYVQTMSLLQTAWEILVSLEKWDARLQRLAEEDSDVKSYFSVFREIYPHPVLFADKNFHILGPSGGCRDFFPGPDDIMPWKGDGDIELEQIQTDLSRELLFTREFQDNCRQSGLYETVLYENNQTGINCNYYKNQEYMGCFCVVNAKLLHTSPGERRLIQYMADRLCPAVELYWKKTHCIGQNQQIHTLFTEILEGKNEPVPQEMAMRQLVHLLKDYGWEDTDRCCVIMLRFFEWIAAENSGSYVCSLLEDTWEFSAAVTAKGQIYWIVNCEKNDILRDNESLKNLILDTVDTYICRAGVSAYYTGLKDILPYVRQAEIALEIGQKHNSHLWYHYFGDYRWEYVLEKITEEFPVQQIGHDGLQKLLAYDQEHGTTYVRSLAEYYHCDKNVSQTAKQLFLHRTSLVRQLARMESIMGLQLSGDFQQDLFLRISLALWEREQSQRA